MKSESLQSLQSQKHARHLQHYLGIKEKLEKKFERGRTVYYCPSEDAARYCCRGTALKVLRVLIRGRKKLVGSDFQIVIEVRTLDIKRKTYNFTASDLKLEYQCKQCPYRLERVIKGCPYRFLSEVKQ